MTHISIENLGVNVSYDDNHGKALSLEFTDPSYARAEALLFDPENMALHAILHEGMYLIGHVPAEYSGYFHTSKEIELRADHYAGAPVSLRAPVSVVRH